ncbi:MAG: hypothetical protein AAGC68_02015 [Verrucomicrobiota bacterium]
MKTGGQTIRAILRKNFGRHHCDMLLREEAKEQDWRWVKKCYPRLQSVRGHCVVPRDEKFEALFPEARYYTFLRDPAARAVSHFLFRERSGDQLSPWRDWLEENGNYFCRRLAGEASAEAAIEVLRTTIGFVGLVEKFDESLLLWAAWSGLEKPDLTFRKVNESPGKPDNIDELLKQAERANSEDRRLFRFALEEIFPAQREAYPGDLSEDRFRLRVGQAKARNWNLKSLSGSLVRNGRYRKGIREIGSLPKVGDS